MTVEDQTDYRYIARGERTSFPAQPPLPNKPVNQSKKAVDVILPEGLALTLQPYSKYYPDNVPDDLSIIWINNIGLRGKFDEIIVPPVVGEDYEIQFDIGVVESDLFYWDEANQKKIPLVKDVDYVISGTKYYIRMRLTDPAIGMGGT